MITVVTIPPHEHRDQQQYDLTYTSESVFAQTSHHGPHSTGRRCYLNHSKPYQSLFPFAEIHRDGYGSLMRALYIRRWEGGDGIGKLEGSLISLLRRSRSCSLWGWNMHLDRACLHYWGKKSCYPCMWAYENLLFLSIYFSEYRRKMDLIWTWLANT